MARDSLRGAYSSRFQGVQWDCSSCQLKWRYGDGRLEVLRAEEQWREGFPGQSRRIGFVKSFQHEALLSSCWKGFTSRVATSKKQISKIQD